MSLAGGVGALVDALVARLPPGSVVQGCRATSVRRSPAGFVVGTSAGTFTAGSVLLAVPSYEAAALVRGLDESLAALCDGVDYASTATVALGYRAEQVAHPMRGTGFVVPRAEGRALLAATWVTSKWPGRAPPGARAAARLLWRRPRPRAARPARRRGAGRSGDAGTGRRARHHRAPGADPRRAMDSAEPAVTSSGTARGCGPSTRASKATRVSSAPAADSAPLASRTALLMAGPRPPASMSGSAIRRQAPGPRLQASLE